MMATATPRRAHVTCTAFAAAVLTALLASTMFMATTAEGYPEIRSGMHLIAKSKRAGIVLSSSGKTSFLQSPDNNEVEARGAVGAGDLGIPMDEPESCMENIPCGFAPYSTSVNTRFRPILDYIKNRLCKCDQGYNCVLTGNRIDRKAYVFHCRRAEVSGHMFQFPGLQ